MNEITHRYDVTRKDLAKGRNMKMAAWASPFLLAGTPAAIFLVLMFLFGTTPPAAATFFFLGLIFTIVGFVLGLGISGFLAYRYSKWTQEMRERIAADGIKADEIEWFRHELKPAERRALKGIDASSPMLADAYRDTLASRLTATRIVKLSKKELMLAKRRQAKLKQLKSANANKFLDEVEQDIDKITAINTEAGQMLAEAETRLEMIEAATARGGVLADSEFALNRLSTRASELPLALEAAKMEEEIRRELENENIE